MDNNINIRKAEIKDIDELGKLLSELFTIETDFVIDIKKQQNGLSLILKNTEQCCIMVAECAEKVIGMCTGQLLVSTSEGGLKVVVEDLVVDADYRGYKVGSKLLSSIENWAASCGALRMDLLADKRNLAALNFYEKHDWKRTQLVALQKKK
jgi:ribosomal protein S18 acetylase RimI-like enzyme